MRAKSTSMALAGVGLVSILHTSTALAQPPDEELVPPGEVAIEKAEAFGNACPRSDTYLVTITEDKKAVLITFDEGLFTAAAGPGLSTIGSSKSCTVITTIRFPEGWTYALGSAVYSGVADLAAGTLGRQGTTYWFPGTPRYMTETVLTGPFFGPYERTDEVELLTWHPCGVPAPRPLTTKINVQASNQNDPQAKGTINVQDAEFAVQYELYWKQCP